MKHYFENTEKVYGNCHGLFLGILLLKTFSCDKIFI